MLRTEPDKYLVLYGLKTIRILIEMCLYLKFAGWCGIGQDSAISQKVLSNSLHNTKQNIFTVNVKKSALISI